MWTLAGLTIALRDRAKARHPEATRIEVNMRAIDCLADILWTDASGNEHCEVVRYWFAGNGPLNEEVTEVY